MCVSLIRCCPAEMPATAAFDFGLPVKNRTRYEDFRTAMHIRGKKESRYI